MKRSFLYVSGAGLGPAPLIARLALLALVVAPAGAMANSRYAGFVWDMTSGKVLYSDKADELRYPASLTKMMTLYLLFEDLERGRVTLETPLQVSPRAASQVPTKLGLKAGETIPVEAAIKGLVTQSANDAAVAIAENLAASEQDFAERMTRTAHDLGMTHTQFRNASGLPDPEQATTARDMAVLGAALQVRFPRYYAYFKTRSFRYQGRLYRGHNRLIGRIRGVDGIKTGYIRAAGFNLVTSVRNNGRKIIGVVFGGRSAKTRDRHMASLIRRYLSKASVGKDYASEIAALGRKPPVAVASAVPSPRLELPTRPAAVAEAAISLEETETAYAIQIGARPSSRAAAKVLRRAQSVSGEILGKFKPMTAPYKSFYRARFVGFTDREEALNVCRQLRKNGISCLTLALTPEEGHDFSR